MQAPLLAAHHDPWIVALSYLIAAVASLTALDLAKRVRTPDRAIALGWWMTGSLTMGTGIWAMHFVGMLAFRLPIPVGYDYLITLLSWIAAVGVSMLALGLASGERLGRRRLVGGALIMGLGIATMHYTGMAALSMEPQIRWDLPLVALSVVIAMVASAAALLIFFGLRGQAGSRAFALQGVAALVMAGAITGMHYTGMAAAGFDADSVCLSANALHGGRLYALISVATLVLLTLTLFTSALDARLAVHHKRLEREVASRTAELQHAKEAAEAASRAKSEFLAAISHELRTPLTSIRGFAELMERRSEVPATRMQAGLIRKGAEHLNALLSQILDLAKVDAGAMSLNQESVELAPLIQGTVDFFALTASEKGLTLEVEIDASVPATLSCDSLRLKQILNNLLSNALKFTDKGRVRIVAERNGRHVAVHVDDTGPGIPQELHELIFEKFRQANERVSYHHGGTGLGLALSRGLAELMNGSLTVQSTLGVGSRFTLTLPIAPVEAPPATPPQI